jgi:hypothetical protein
MSIAKDILIVLFSCIFAFCAIISLFSPFILAGLSGNYWYLFLFFVTWIPTNIFMDIANGILKWSM